MVRKESKQTIFRPFDKSAQSKNQFSYFSTKTYVVGTIAPDKDWRQLGIYPPLFDLIGYFKF